MDYKARFYSPYLNHFIQPDTLIPDPSNPQAWNRYSYVYNRPINLNDPTGHDGGLGIGLAIVALFYVGLFAFAYFSNPESFKPEPTLTPTATPTRSHTSTMNPTLSSLLTAPPTGSITPVSKEFLNPGPTATSTPRPLPTAINPLDIINDQINSADPAAPGIGNVIIFCAPYDYPCQFGVAADNAWNTFILTGKFVKDSFSSLPVDEKKTVVSATATTTPTSRTPSRTPTLPFRTPTSTPY